MSLQPPASADSARQRGQTSVDFKSATTGVAAKAMRNELNRMTQGVTDPAKKKIFDAEMQSFFLLFNRFLTERAKGEKLDWEKINPPNPKQLLPYPTNDNVDPSILNKLAVLKLNGGLGTTMGCVGPKSVIEVRDGMTFLDLSVRQIEHLNSQYGVDVPLILMNSFNTDEDTARVIQQYSNHQVSLLTFNQSRYPRIDKETLLPCPTSYESDKGDWYPPGHGDIFDALTNTGLLDKLIAAGKEYIFISNVDNLGATVSPALLNMMIEKDVEYLSEVTKKTKADVKGGTIIDYEGQVRLLEVAQVPKDHMDEFCSTRRFKIFNTNSVWMKTSAIKRVMDEDALSLEIIVNPKQTDKGRAVIQLETAMGAAIKHFNRIGVEVPRSRFLPVKQSSDLLLIKSKLYNLQHGALTMDASREFGGTPVIKLGPKFKKVQDFDARMPSIPNILELDHLTISGDVHIGKGVTLGGVVIIVANDGQTIRIPDGSRLTDKLVTGSLAIIDH